MKKIVITVVAAAAAVAAACGGSGETPNPPPSPSGEPVADSSAMPADSGAPSAAPSDSAAADAAKHTAPPRNQVSLPNFAWTKTPDTKNAPSEGAKGSVNGMAIELVAGEIKRVVGEWRFDFGESNDFEDRQFVSIQLPQQPATGKPLKKKFSPGGGIFQMIDLSGDRKPTRTSADTQANTAANAWAIEFTKVDLKPYDEKKKGVQDGGKASGKIVVCYDASGSITKQSWVAGTFTDVKITYMDEQKGKKH